MTKKGLRRKTTALVRGQEAIAFALTVITAAASCVFASDPDTEKQFPRGIGHQVNDRHHFRQSHRSYRHANQFHRSHHHGHHHPDYSDSYLAQMKAAGRKLDKSSGVITPCGTSAMTFDLQREMGDAHASWRDRHGNRDRDLSSARYVIPVYFHVFKRPPVSASRSSPAASAENRHDDYRDTPQHDGSLLKDDRNRFMRKLNQAYRSTPFWFRLLGHDEHVHGVWAACRDEIGFKRETRVEGSDVLNVYVCDTDASQPGMVGYAHFPPVLRGDNPELDGVGTSSVLLGTLP